MWTRRELKEKAKGCFKGNYWKAVLVALLASMLINGAGASSTAPAASVASTAGVVTSAGYSLTAQVPMTMQVTYTVSDPSGAIDGEAQGNGYDALNGGANLTDTLQEIGSIPEIVQIPGDTYSSAVSTSITALMLILAPILLIAFIVGIVLAVFIVNPLIVGTSRFFLSNLSRPGDVREVGRPFDVNYRETVRTMFWVGLKTFLWTLLFIIPGIVKSLEYRMIPYLLADDPEMTKDRAFEESKRLMHGNKWKAFVLDLSFIGWHILSVFTLGLLSIFYVEPYRLETNAALYEQLRYGGSVPVAIDTHAPAHIAPSSAEA